MIDFTNAFVLTGTKKTWVLIYVCFQRRRQSLQQLTTIISREIHVPMKSSGCARFFSSLEHEKYLNAHLSESEGNLLKLLSGISERKPSTPKNTWVTERVSHVSCT